jgi:DNA helicase II / ATP-dependent DNA helicase PcrA
MSHLGGLNEHQRAAAKHQKGPLLVFAGAGAGKTRVIAHRIVGLVEKGVHPGEILAVTFTNKAAKEMRDRVSSLLSKSSPANLTSPERNEPFISTFHSLGVRILREDGKLIGLPSRFSIADRQDSIKLVKEAIRECGLDPKTFDPRIAQSAISKQKGEGRTQTMYGDYVQDNFFATAVAQVWELYEKFLRESKTLDFDDLLLRTVELLTNHKNIREKYRLRWKYIHIDEYQDTNSVQYTLIELLVGPENNICAVGDIDQMIYSWRGATLENISKFEEHFEDTTVVILEQNYRSTQTILNAANAIITKNINRREKNLFTQNGVGEPITLLCSLDETAEAYSVCAKIKKLVNTGVRLQSIAVLYRANFQSRILEEAFLARGIPYHLIGTRFFERKEVKDVLAYARLALNPQSTADLARIINTPSRGIGKVTLLTIVEGHESELRAGAKLKVESFRTIMKEIEEVAGSLNASEVIKFIMERSGIKNSLSVKNDEDMERLENLKELVTLASKYDDLPPLSGLEKLLEDASLAADQDALIKEEDAVKLMTVHSSKGLEFAYVFIAGLEEGLFPHEVLDERVDTEEERRLFYVALTRAQKKVYLSFSQHRTIYGTRESRMPSTFIMDLNTENIELDSENEPQKIVYIE